jgi:hypothetical protein
MSTVSTASMEAAYHAVVAEETASRATSAASAAPVAQASTTPMAAASASSTAVSSPRLLQFDFPEGFKD